MSDQGWPLVSIVNESSVLLQFGEQMDAELPQRIAFTQGAIRSALGHFIVEYIPSYTTLLITVDSALIKPLNFEVLLKKELESICLNGLECIDVQGNSRDPIIIPMCYDPAVAPDLLSLSNSRGLSVEEVVRLHCEKTYTVFAIGFSPGFAFMGVVDSRIAEPRHSTPRAKVLRGSLGIAGTQTGIYPADSPGGWNIIARTPIPMLELDASERVSCLMSTGDRVQFKPITLDEYYTLSRGEACE